MRYLPVCQYLNAVGGTCMLPACAQPLPPGSVTDVPGMKRVLRSNGWPNDGLSTSSPWDAICARGDIDPDDPDAYGCFDGKVTNYKCVARDS